MFAESGEMQLASGGEVARSDQSADNGMGGRDWKPQYRCQKDGGPGSQYDRKDEMRVGDQTIGNKTTLGEGDG